MSQVTSIAQEVGASVIGLRRGARRGSGIVVAPDRVAVLRHSIARTPVEVVFGDGRRADGELAGVDRRSGIALLAVPTGETPAVRFADNAPQLGDVVFALGNPGGSGLRLTEGRVSAVPLTVRGRHGRSVEGVIEHTAPLPRGSGAGPLVDAGGAVLGLNVLRGDPGFLLALPSAVVRPAIERLLQGQAQTGHLGLALVPPRASRRMRAAVGLPDRDGLIVREVEAGGPADHAGVQAGDLIVGLGETDVKTIDDVFRTLDAAADDVSIRLVRGTEELELAVTLGGAPA
jgi:serine protease Do